MCHCLQAFRFGPWSLSCLSDSHWRTGASTNQFAMCAQTLKPGHASSSARGVARISATRAVQPTFTCTSAFISETERRSSIDQARKPSPSTFENTTSKCRCSARPSVVSEWWSTFLLAMRKRLSGFVRTCRTWRSSNSQFESRTPIGQTCLLLGVSFSTLTRSWLKWTKRTRALLSSTSPSLPRP